MNELPANLDDLANLTLMVHLMPARLAQEIVAWPRDGRWVVISVSREIYTAPGDTAHDRRGAMVMELLRDCIIGVSSPCVVLTDISLLFDPDLALDPLALLRQLSRQAKLVVAWLGTYQDDVLNHAVPEHAHYRTWQSPDAHIITLR